MSSQAPAVEFNELSFQFADKLAVDNLNLTVPEGSIYGLLGPNGAGKTTAIRMLVTILPPFSGHIRVFGIDVARRPSEARRTFGYVPQALSADSALTARENVALFARLFDVPRRQRRQRVDEVLGAMGLGESADKLAKTLSGGQVRRLEMAQALISSPRLLVLDEPTVGLDPIARDQLWEQIQKLRDQQGLTVLLTTHYMGEADALCDTVGLMHQGRLRVTGSPQKLKEGLGPARTLDDVFRHYAGEEFSEEGGDFKNVQNSRRTARRLG